MGETLFGLHAKKHEERPNQLCKHFAITLKDDWIDVKRLAALRNDLLHEALWHGARPGSTFGELGYSIPVRMRYLNRELISAFLEIR